MPFRRRLLVVLALAALLLVGSGPAVGAHAVIQDASPAPGATVSGRVAEASVLFLEPVLPGATLEVRGPDGQLVDGLTPAQVDGRSVSVTFTALTRAGAYRVDYGFASVDGHPGTGAHQFRFEPEASSTLGGVLPVTLESVRLFLHVLAATIWVGGQLTLAGLVPGLRAIDADAPRNAARRFNRIAWPAFGVLVITGLWNLSEVSFGDRSTSYQVTLFVKLIVVGVSGAAAAVHSTTSSRRLLIVGGALGLVAALVALYLGLQLSLGDAT